MTEEEAMKEMLARSDKLATRLAAAMDDVPAHDKSFSVAVVTFLRLASYAALRLHMPKDRFLAVASGIFDGSKGAMENDDYLGTKH